MEKIAADAPLDYVEFRISPQNNYDVFICCGEVEERVGCALADQLSTNLPKGSFSEGCPANIRLQLPENLDSASWFSKAVVTRFLKITDSHDALKTIVALSNEMSQLEETRKFHLSLYVQAENGASDDSKNELLRAVISRLTALGEELTTAFNLAAGEACSQEEMKNLEKFCGHLGYTDLRNTLGKLIESSRSRNVTNTLDHKKSPVTSDSQLNPVNNSSDNTQISRLSNVDQPVKYDASPAKAAQVERLSTTESEENSSNSSEEEDRSSVERSRTLARSTTPRRSASPMRRIQIGRSGSRRTPAIAIKSLSYFPGRERAFSSRDTAQNDDDGEVNGSEQASKVPDSNVRRMSVQDAINLFERKQRDQSTDVQKRKTQIDNPVKPVLRRWSSGMGESSALLADQSISENKVEASDHRLIDEENTSNVAKEVQPDTCPATGLSESGRAVETCKELETGDGGSPSSNHTDVAVAQEGTSEKMDSTEWNRQKEEELNQMLMTFALSEPTSKYQKTEPGDSKNHDSEMGKGRGLYDQNKNRSRRLQGEKAEMKMIKEAVKKTDKKSSSRTVKKSLGKSTKVEPPSANSSDAGRKQVASGTQKERVIKHSPLSSNMRRELPRAVVQKAPPKSSSFPTMRKSWPSTPFPRGTGIVAANTPLGVTTSGPASLRQKSQLSGPFARSTPKAENPQPQSTEARKTQAENGKSTKSANENKPQMVPKSVKKTKAEVVSVSKEKTSTLSVKPGLRSRVTKKSSVVPLEAKPSSSNHKVSAASPVKSLAPKKKGNPSPVKEPLSKSTTPVKETLTKRETPICSQDDEVIILSASEQANKKVDKDSETDEIHHVDLEREAPVESLPHCGGQEEIPSETPAKCNDIETIIVPSPAEVIHEEESNILPTASVKNGQQDFPIASSDSASQLASSNRADAASSGTRVRHSLSQMLLEESSEADAIEWGNAENPPSMVFQKDAPKGLKRLLKLARKTKGEANIASWSSSPFTSEGEDDGDECKGFGKKDSNNLLKKAALNASSQHGQLGILSDGRDKSLVGFEPPSVRSNTSNSSFQSSSSVTSKASRSFFSLSAFRGNKATDSKMH